MISHGTRDIIIRHNPLYFISALLMLGGYYLMVAPMQVARSEQNLLILFGVINCYEAILIGTAWCLKKRDSAHPHRYWLIGLETMFLCDPTFLIEAMHTTSPSLGLIVGGIFVLLSIVKLAILQCLLDIRFDPAYFVSRIVFPVIIAVLPGWLLSVLPENKSVELVSWMGWNVFAVTLWGLLVSPPSRSSGAPAIVVRAIDLLPAAFCALHLIAADFVVSFATKPYFFAMPLLSLAIVLALFSAWGRRHAGQLLAVALIWCSMLAFNGYTMGEVVLPGAGIVELTSLTLIFLCGAAAYIVLMRMLRKLFYLLPAFALCMLAYCNGRVSRWAFAVPEGRTGWGIMLVLLAFGVLFLGVAVSVLMRRNSGSKDDPPRSSVEKLTPLSSRIH